MSSDSKSVKIWTLLWPKNGETSRLPRYAELGMLELASRSAGAEDRLFRTLVDSFNDVIRHLRTLKHCKNLYHASSMLLLWISMQWPSQAVKSVDESAFITEVLVCSPRRSITQCHTGGKVGRGLKLIPFYIRYDELCLSYDSIRARPPIY